MDKWFNDIVFAEKLTERGGVWCDDVSPMDGVSYDDEAHDALFEVEDSSFWFVNRNRIIESGIKANPPMGNCIVEIGGGNGNTAKYLADSGFETAMFEPRMRGCANAVRRGQKNVVNAFFDAEHVQPKSVGAVGMFDVLEHIRQDVEFLHGIRELLTDDGLLYITVPAHKALWSASDDGGHFRRYNRKKLFETVESAGFKTLQASYFFWFLPSAILLFRVLPYRLARFACVNRTKHIRRTFIMPRFVDELVKILLEPEIRHIHKGKSVPFGASLFLSAKVK
jgi:hypothetical protein